MRIYNVNKVTASNKLARKTGCSVNALNKLIKRGIRFCRVYDKKIAFKGTFLHCKSLKTSL